MGLWVEVESVTKGCAVMVNLDEVVEIAPLREGGCALFFPNPNVPEGRSEYKVKDNYSMFKQFALQTVSGEAIAEKISAINKFHGVDEQSEEVKRSPGRPKKVSE